MCWSSAAAREALATRHIVPAPRILSSVEELPEGSVTGWIFSNELYDALPVARVVGSEGGLQEMRVGAEGVSPSQSQPRLITLPNVLIAIP